MLEKLEGRLVDGWRSSWRWFSVQMHVAACLLLEVLQVAPVLPPEVQKLIPQPWGQLATAAWTVLGLAARLMRQKSNAAR